MNILIIEDEPAAAKRLRKLLPAVDPAIQVAALIVGGTVAAASHAFKAGSRVLINTSPEPFSNWGASVAEDLSVIAGLWTALNHPWLFLALLLVFLLLVAWLLPKILRAIRQAGRALRRCALPVRGKRCGLRRLSGRPFLPIRLRLRALARRRRSAARGRQNGCNQRRKAPFSAFIARLFLLSALRGRLLTGASPRKQAKIEISEIHERIPKFRPHFTRPK